MDNDYNKVLRCVLDYFTEVGADYYHKMTRKGYLRHLLVRRSAKTGELLLNVITTSQEEELLKKLISDEDSIGDINDREKAQKIIYDPLIKRLLNLELTGSIGGISYL